MVSSFPLESLPENPLIHICSKVAEDSVKGIYNLQLVSKTFHRLCNDTYVLRRVSWHAIKLRPWFPLPEHYTAFANFGERCCKAQNPEAIYRAAVVQFFHPDSDGRKQKQGLQQIGEAARLGVREAEYMHGFILICLGGETKQMGFQILTPLVKTLVEGNRRNEWLEENWTLRLLELRWMGQPMVQRLKSSYVRKNCSCYSGRAGLHAKPGYDYPDRYDRFRMLVFFLQRLQSVLCDICLCHFTVQILFDRLEALDAGNQ